MTTTLTRIIKGRTRDLGGFEVKRVLPAPGHRMVGPFIFFDQMGPARFEPGQGIDVRPHPHIGLATVTYLFDGALGHRDSLGVEQVIRPGDVNWMTAGRGVVHSERTPPEEREAGHDMFGIQTWVALPEDKQDMEPAFFHHGANSLPRFTRDGIDYVLILGTAWDETSPVEVFSPIVYLHGEAPAGSTSRIDLAHEEVSIYLVTGDISVDGQALAPGEMAVLEPGASAELSAKADSRIMISGGAPLGPRLIDWNLVSTDQAHIDQARQDWAMAAETNFPETGRFTLPPHEQEHIPLPAKPG